jgi:uncharacterized protein YbjT (DUF2867 family)
MKVVVIGGTGLVGSKLVAHLAAHGHEAVAAAPNTGVNTLTGEGLAQVLSGAQAVVDVSNSPSFEEQEVLDFFTTSTTNLLAAAAAAGVGHYVALSVVGTQRLAQSPYFRGKIAQEKLIAASGAAYTIVAATQFFEFVRGIANSSTVDGVVRLPRAMFQPMAADDVASAIARIALGRPAGGTVEVAGPQPYALADLVTKALALDGDPRMVVTDPQAHYFGSPLEEDTLLPGPGAHLSEMTYDEWAAKSST